MRAFQPNALSPNTLKKWVKTCRQKAPAILGRPLAQHEAQELIAQTLGHANWHVAMATLQTPVPTVAALPPTPDATTALFLHALLFLGSPRSDVPWSLPRLLAVLEQPLPEDLVEEEDDSLAPVRATFEAMAEIAVRIRQGVADTGSWARSLMDHTGASVVGCRAREAYELLRELDPDRASRQSQMEVFLKNTAGPMALDPHVARQGIQDMHVRARLLHHMAHDMDIVGSSFRQSLARRKAGIDRQNRHGQFPAWQQVRPFLDMIEGDFALFSRVSPLVGMAQALAPCAPTLAIGLLLAHQAGWSSPTGFRQVFGPRWLSLRWPAPGEDTD